MTRPRTTSRIGRARRASAASMLDEASIGRIEAWVVSTLDGRGRPSADSDGGETRPDFAPARRPSPSDDDPSARAPAATGPWARFRLARRRGVAVVSLTDQALVRDDDLDELAGDLGALVEAGHLRIVLDFFAVERLSSWAARTLNRAVGACLATPGGSVKVSGLRPDVAAMFAMTGLHPAVAVYPDTASAVSAAWPERPPLRPLPVSILSALVRAGEARQPRQAPLADPGERAEEPPAMIGARLVVQDGPWMGRSIPVVGPRCVIGRGPDCQVRVGSGLVSRAHARIERRGRRWFVRDLASTNGSRVNGRPLRDREVELADGDRLQVGPVSFALAVGPAPASARAGEWEADDLGDRSRLDDATDATGEYPPPIDLGAGLDLKHEVIEGVLVVTPLVPELDGAEAVEAFREALIALAAAAWLPDRVVVNLTHVGRLSGRAIGALVAHHLRLDRTGGALRVCLAGPRVALILEQVRLGAFIACHPSVEDAVLAAWPEPAPARG